MNITGYGDCITEPDTVGSPVLSVLYVDDEPILLDVCKLFLERRPDISVSVAGSVENALILLKSSSFDVIVSDYQMPGTDGIGFLKILRENQFSIPFILFTGHGREEIMAEAISNGAMFYIQKSGNPRSQFIELDQKIREAYRKRQTEETFPETG
jgi:DNA-binding NtrC family response regulator